MLEWCEEKPIKYNTKILNKFPKRVICPKCKQRFKPRFETCGDILSDGKLCLHILIPAHKIRKKKPRRQSKDVRNVSKNY